MEKTNTHLAVLKCPSNGAISRKKYIIFFSASWFCHYWKANNYSLISTQVQEPS